MRATSPIMTADGNLERIREDLIRRARMERGLDLEQGLPHGNSPEELGEDEERARGGLAGLFTRMNERRQQRQQMPEVEVVEEPKSPVVVQQGAGHRFTLPRFSRFWASGANGPGSPAPSHSEWPSALPTFNTDYQAGGLSPPQLATHARSTIRAPSSFYSSMEDVSTSQDTSSSRPRHERRHGRRRHKHKKRGHRGSRKRSKKQPKRFLGCFPWVKSREMRAQILRCFVTGLFLVSLLSVCKCFIGGNDSVSDTNYWIACVRSRSIVNKEHPNGRLHYCSHRHHCLGHTGILLWSGPSVRLGSTTGS